MLHVLPSPSPAPEREPPHSIETEQALLGAILLNNEVLHRVSGRLEPHHFKEGLHGEIYAAAAKMIQAGRLADGLTLAPFFESAEPIQPADGGPPMPVPRYLGRLTAAATTIINARDYADTIRDLAVRRSIIEIATDMANAAFDAPVDFPPVKQIEEAESRLDGLRQTGRHEREFVSIYDAMRSSIERTNAAYQNGSGLVGFSTGLRALDEKLGGFGPSDLIVVGARPGVGKTAFLGTVACSVARAGMATEVFSLEMSKEQIAERVIAGGTGISSDRQRRGALDEGGMRALLAESETYRDVPLYIDEFGGLTIAQIAVRARRVCRRRKVGLIAVDYLQLLGGSEFRRQASRVQEITEITTNLKALAKELNVAILLLSQLNRNVESRDDKRPHLADLKDSGSIEQDADVVLFLYREEYYLEWKKDETDPAAMIEWEDNMRRCAGKAEVIIAKNRHGRTGTVELAFDGELALFSDLGGRA